jgi:hypothetical protein
VHKNHPPIKSISKYFNQIEVGEAQNVFANICKILGKSIWSFFLPALLSIPSFSAYATLQYYSATLIPTCNLGTAQVILRNGKQSVPVLGFLLHTLLHIILQSILLSFIFNKLTNSEILLIALYTFSNICYTNFCARLKGLQLFKIALIVETFGLLLFIMGIATVYFINSIIIYTIVIEIIIFTLISIFSIFWLIKFDEKNIFNFNGFRNFIKGIYNVGYMAILDSVLWKLAPLYFIALITNYKNVEQPVFLFMVLVGNAAVLIPQSIIESWIPQLAELHQTNLKAFIEYFKSKLKILKIVLVALIVLVFIGLLITLNTLYHKFFGWFWTIIIFVLLRILSSFFDLYSATLYATHNEKSLILPSTIGAISIVILSTIFYKLFGFNGVLLAYLCSKYILSIFTYTAFKNVFYKSSIIAGNSKK